MATSFLQALSWEAGNPSAIETNSNAIKMERNFMIVFNLNRNLFCSPPDILKKQLCFGCRANVKPNVLK